MSLGYQSFKGIFGGVPKVGQNDDLLLARDMEAAQADRGAS